MYVREACLDGFIGRAVRLTTLIPGIEGYRVRERREVTEPSLDIFADVELDRIVLFPLPTRRLDVRDAPDASHLDIARR